MGSLALTKEVYVKKHNAAIRSYSQMTLLQRKVANTLLYNAYYDLINKDFHEITILQLLSLLSMKTNDYKKLKQTITQLMSIVIEWNVTKKTEHNDKNVNEKLFDSNESWRACTLLASVQIDGTNIKYEYSKTLRNLFFKPSLYSRVSLAIQNKFKSLYSLSLYENCMSYVNCGTSGWISFDIFRKLMGVNDGQYKTFRDFSRRVLKPAVLEINNTSDIAVVYEIRKAMKFPSHIKFLVDKNKAAKANVLIENESNDLVEKLIKYGLSKQDGLSIIKKYDAEFILEKLSLIQDSKAKINNIAAFLKAALKNDYKKNNIMTNESKNDYFQNKEEKEKQDILKKEYKIFVDNIYKNWLRVFTIEEKLELFNKMVEHHETSMLPAWKKAKLKLDSEDWIENPDIFLSIKTYILSTKDCKAISLKFPKIESFLEYLSMKKN
ncbi:MAG TPA: replication initiation protein [Gammaproteobacteria bacterium]|mgnify:CR=1 FL=1|nr:replication initiation protein [Gammaproteobacteria bacterium]